MDTWVPAGSGLSKCLTHIEAEPFAPHIGCAGCNSSPAPGPEAPQSGEGERLCAEAEERNLPDAFEVEARMWNVWRFATKRAEHAARMADRLSGVQDTELPIIEPDLKLAATYEQAAAKWMDVSVKAGKLATQPVLHRERMAELERRNRTGLLGSRGQH